jgi:hypothetical protein
MRSNSCPKCQGSMAEGFILDINQGGTQTVSTWIEGAPDKRWYGLKTGGRVKHEIQTWRCGRCGFLENYARG